jgi:hypothetical protein
MNNQLVLMDLAIIMRTLQYLVDRDGSPRDTVRGSVHAGLEGCIVLTENEFNRLEAGPLPK